jgi:hypothetical protein
VSVESFLSTAASSNLRARPRPRKKAEKRFVSARVTDLGDRAEMPLRTENPVWFSLAIETTEGLALTYSERTCE